MAHRFNTALKHVKTLDLYKQRLVPWINDIFGNCGKTFSNVLKDYQRRESSSMNINKKIRLTKTA